MSKRTLGNTSISIEPFAFGGNVFGWTANEATSHQLLEKFTAEGFQLIDTADIYSTWTNQPGISETIIGNWLKKSGKRKEVVIATKVGMEMGAGKSGLSKKHIHASVEDSLRRLQTDYIDLYQSHQDDPLTPQEETAEAFDQLIRQGKIRASGASNFSGARLASALKISRENKLSGYNSIQPAYNLYDREKFEKDLQEICAREKVGVIAYYSLASGFLTGKYRSREDFSKSVRGAAMEKYLNPRGLRILEALDRAIAQLNVKPAQVALAWLLTRPGITAPIASATTVAQLEELIAGVRLTLPQSILSDLNQSSGP